MGLLLSVLLMVPVQAAESHPSAIPFQPIEQPLPVKLAVTGVGLGLMALELTWFLKK